MIFKIQPLVHGPTDASIFQIRRTIDELNVMAGSVSAFSTEELRLVYVR